MLLKEKILIHAVIKCKNKGIINEIDKLMAALINKCSFIFGKIAVKHAIYNPKIISNEIQIEKNKKILMIILCIILFVSADKLPKVLFLICIDSLCIVIK